MDMPGESQNDLAELAAALIHSRRTVLPRWLGAPGPDAEQLQQIVLAAAAAPDHGQLCPWRFVRVPAQARDRLGAAFAQALRERDPSASEADCAKAAAKAHNAPELMLAVARLGAVRSDPPRSHRKASPPVGTAERLVSLGCALQNMQLVAHALGFGAAITGGQALESAALRGLFELADAEQAVCFLSIGTVLRRPGGLLRPHPAAFVQTLGIKPRVLTRS